MEPLMKEQISEKYKSVNIECIWKYMTSMYIVEICLFNTTNFKKIPMTKNSKLWGKLVINECLK